MANICQDNIEKVKVTISQRHLIALILFIKLNESKFYIYGHIMCHFT